jgi:uncharacterized repeat protein (TIGR01451 family)
MRRISVFPLLRTSAALFVLSVAIVAAVVTASTAPAFQSVGSEFVTTYADDCATPKTIFEPGEIVCVQAGNFPVLNTDWGYRYRRVSWVSPNREVMDQTSIKSDPQYDRFAIPTSGSAGTWYVTTLDSESSRYGNAKFIVRSAFARTSDLAVLKDGPATVYAGQRVEFVLTVTNPGPDSAEVVEVYTEVPSYMTFVALKQSSGPLLECRTPAQGEIGRIYCSTKGMRLDESARLHAYYDVSRDAKEGTICSATTQVTSYTEELNKEDNLKLTETQVVLENPPYQGEPPPDNE